MRLINQYVLEAWNASRLGELDTYQALKCQFRALQADNPSYYQEALRQLEILADEKGVLDL